MKDCKGVGEGRRGGEGKRGGRRKKEGEREKEGEGRKRKQQLPAAPPAGPHLNVFQLILQVTSFCLQQICPVQRLLQSLRQAEDVALLQVHLLLQLGLLGRGGGEGSKRLDNVQSRASFQPWLPFPEVPLSNHLLHLLPELLVVCSSKSGRHG